MVIAPDSDWSGASSALGRLHPDNYIEVQKVELPNRPDIEAYAVNGPPALTVLTGQLGAFDVKFDAVVSGINAGSNTGRAVLHSGTVGAVLTGQNFGLSGLAVSVQSGDAWYWDTAAALACDVLGLLEEAPPRSALNLNAPARPLGGREGSAVGATRTLRRSAQRARRRGRRSLPVRVARRAGRFRVRTRHGSGLAPRRVRVAHHVGGCSRGVAGRGADAMSTSRWSNGWCPGAPLHEVHRVPDASERHALRRPRLASS